MSFASTPIDFQSLLHATDYDEDRAGARASQFASRSAGAIDEMQSAFDCQDAKEVICVAGRLKVTAQDCFADAIADSADEIERMASNEDLAGANVAFGELQAGVIRLQEWIENRTLRV